MTYYTQCQLVRQAEHGVHSEVVWIPAQLAHKGAQLKVRRGGTWQEGWVVDATYATNT